MLAMCLSCCYHPVSVHWRNFRSAASAVSVAAAASAVSVTAAAVTAAATAVTC